MLYFFLSRAPGDDDRYVAKFYEDLSAEVERLVDAEGEVGAVTVQSSVGSDDVANEALGACRVFVALCSPRYFLTERCGREWALFADRVRRYERAMGTEPEVLIPIVWAYTDPLARPVGVTERLGAGPEPPTPEGVSQLIRLRRLRSSYRDFVRSLARRIVTAANAYEIPPPSPGFTLRSVASGFGYPDWHQSARVQFVVAAGTRDEMGALRQDVSFYGDNRRDWAPYRSVLAEPLVAHARQVAAERLFGSDIVDFAAVVDHLDLVDRHNAIIVLLVDAWVVLLEEHRRTLVDLNGRREFTVAILVPSSDDDAETVQRRVQLTAGVLDAFPNYADRQDPMFRAEIGTPESFDADLAAALEKAQNHIFRFGRVYRRPLSDPPAKRPLLKGP